MSEEEHKTYMLKKQKKTISSWEKVMLIGNGLFSDFDEFPIESNTNSSQKTKATPDKSTTNQNIKTKKPIKNSKRNRRFPLGRVEQ